MLNLCMPYLKTVLVKMKTVYFKCFLFRLSAVGELLLYPLSFNMPQK